MRWSLKLSLGLIFFLAACGGGQAEIPLADTQWRLREIGGQPVAAGLTVPTARFQKDGKLQGNAGCNSYFTNYEAKDGALTFQVIAHTEMACTQVGQMELEDRYIKALGRAKAYNASSQQLQIKSATGDVLMTFEPLAAK